MDLTKQIADFVVGTSYGAISTKALEVAKTAIIDALGVTLAGSQENSARICGALIREEGAKSASTVIGQGFKSSPVPAAFVNGTAFMWASRLTPTNTSCATIPKRGFKESLACRIFWPAP